MTSKRIIGNIALTIAIVAVALSATVLSARAEGGDRQGNENRNEHRNEGRGHEERWRGDYYPEHREYYGGGYYAPSPPVVLVPPLVSPEFNIIIPFGR
jgi:hypothetical protein